MQPARVAHIDEKPPGGHQELSRTASATRCLQSRLEHWGWTLTRFWFGDNAEAGVDGVVVADGATDAYV